MTAGESDQWLDERRVLKDSPRHSLSVTTLAAYVIALWTVVTTGMSDLVVGSTHTTVLCSSKYSNPTSGLDV